MHESVIRHRASTKRMLDEMFNPETGRYLGTGLESSEKTFISSIRVDDESTIADRDAAIASLEPEDGWLLLDRQHGSGNVKSATWPVLGTRATLERLFDIVPSGHWSKLCDGLNAMTEEAYKRLAEKA